MRAVMTWLIKLVKDPKRISKFCVIYIASYYLVSIFSICAVKSGDPTAVWRRNGGLDIVTSITWFAFAVILIWSLAKLAFSASLTLTYLIVYYFLFIFLFAFCYGILNWHWPGMLEGVSRDSWTGLLEHVLISVETQTTIGYIRGKPKHVFAEAFACLQALLGIFLITISIAKAVNKQTEVKL